MAPLKVKNLQQVNALSTICPSRPAAEFLRGFGTDRGLAAEFDTQPVACVSIMKTHLIIDIITSRRYIGTGPASARGPQHPVRASTILLAFVATALCGVALGQMAPAAAIVSDVPVADGTERLLFLGVGRHAPSSSCCWAATASSGWTAATVSTSSAETSWCERLVNGSRRGLP